MEPIVSRLDVTTIFCDVDDKKKSEVRSQKSEVKKTAKNFSCGYKPTKIKRFMSRHAVRDIIIPYFKPSTNGMGLLLTSDF